MLFYAAQISSCLEACLAVVGSRCAEAEPLSVSGAAMAAALPGRAALQTAGRWWHGWWWRRGTVAGRGGGP
jgi:hypothetical protein